MTIIEAINQIDELKPNSYPQSQKVKWLSTLDGLVKRLIIDTHEGAESVTFNGYTDEIPIGTELLVPAPYDEIYLRWLESKIDYSNGEYARYNNTAAAYQAEFDTYRNYYNQTHTPICCKNKFF